MAIEAAAQLMLKHPNSAVAVKDLQIGEVTAIDYNVNSARRRNMPALRGLLCAPRRGKRKETP
jgi:hypothetical protein